MRAVFVNHCHPECPHVCGTRAREFANALARRGHKIVLLTETLRRDDAALAPGDLATALAAHDWARPFSLACPPRPAPILEALRTGRLPAAARKAVIFYQYMARGGMFTDWRAGSRPYWRTLAATFRPQLVWGIFGNTDAWAIAQGIAAAAGCPWVRDIKDQWTRFIPGPVRNPLARRFADAAATTALSQANAADAAPWFCGPASVVYSGFSAGLLANQAGPDPQEPFTLALTGAIYDKAALTILVDGIAAFLAAGGRGRVRLTYAGTDVESVIAACRTLEGRLELDLRGQIPFGQYWSIVGRANVNLYVRSPETGWWHHKIVELLAARRPVLCCPGEMDEARSLSASVGGELHDCPRPSAVAEAMEKAWTQRLAPRPVGDLGRLASLTWDARAEELLRAFSACGVGAEPG